MELFLDDVFTILVCLLGEPYFLGSDNSGFDINHN